LVKKLTLGKNERLKSRKLIDELFSNGKKFTITPYRVLYLIKKGAPSTLQFSVTAGSKQFKKAVDRNRIKRLVREAYRLQKTTLQNKLKDENIQLAIFLIYTGNELPVYKDVYAKMTSILEKLTVISSDVK
jgi:ribonuclease P protein component